MSAIYYFHDPSAPKPNKPARAGAAVVIYADGKILLGHRKDNYEWGVVTGDLHDDETFAACAVRRTFSETGIVLKERQLQTLKLFDNPGRIVSFDDGNIYRMIHMGYFVELFLIPETVCSDASLELRFVDPADLGCYTITAAHQEVLEEFLKRKGINASVSRTIWSTRS